MKTVSKKLILEHALLVAELNEKNKEETKVRLKDIENELGMTASEIAQEALSIYQDGYKK